MYLHKENKELFRDAILLTSERLGVFETCKRSSFTQSKMGNGIAPAAPSDVDIPEVVQKIYEEDFYRDDYKETTLKLISDSLEYEMLKKHYMELVKRIF